MLGDTLGFRIVKGTLTGASVDGVGRVVPQLKGPIINPTHPALQSANQSQTTPPSTDSVSSKSYSRILGLWSADEDNMLRYAVRVTLASKQPFRWKDVARLVKTRDIRQCRYHWYHHIDTDTKPRTRKRKNDECDNTNLSKFMLWSNELEDIQSESYDIGDDFAVALGLVSGCGVFDAVTPSSFDTTTFEESYEEKDLHLISNVQGDGVWNDITCTLHPKPYFVRVVKHVTYKGATTKTTIGMPSVFADNFHCKERFANINRVLKSG